MIKKEDFRLYSYSFLSQALDYPSTESMTKILGSDLIEVICSYKEALIKEKPNASSLIISLENIQNIFPEAENISDSKGFLLELQKEYTRLCHASKPRLLPLFESVYREGKLLQESTVEVARLYYGAGLKLDKDFSLPPDHISLELEFMAYLCSQEIEAIREKDSFVLGKANKLQQRMLTEHLQFFVPEFARRLQKHASLEFYKVTGRYLENYIDWELSCL
jgi:TorA maturation chaperone TorD